MYIDSVLPFDLHSAPLLFSAVADALSWIMKTKESRQEVPVQVRPFHSGQTLGPFCATELECQDRFRMVAWL